MVLLSDGVSHTEDEGARSQDHPERPGILQLLGRLEQIIEEKLSSHR
jgi:hypothetical protein